MEQKLKTSKERGIEEESVSKFACNVIISQQKAVGKTYY